MSTAGHELQPDAIFQVVTGFMASKLLLVANELGLFTLLADGPATLDELAGRAGTPVRTTRIVVDAMAALGFVEREGDAYRNGALADAFLSGRGPVNISPMLRFMNAISYPQWARLEDAVRTDAAVKGAFSEEQQTIFSEGVEAFTAGAAHALPEAYDFSRHRRLLDVGGGTGSFLLAALSANPDLQGTLFELPEVATIAARKLGASPVAERATVLAGDARYDELPRGHDVVLLAHVIHYCLPDEAVELARTIRAVVEPDARFILVDFWTDPTHSQPVPAALMAGEFLTMVGGDVYSELEMNGWLAEAGWRPIGRIPLPGGQSAIIAEAV